MEIATLDPRTRARWRRWLGSNHARSPGVWLVFHKQGPGRTGMSYGEALDEALCFGWIDSLVRRIDDDRYARKFTPRRADSRWSTANRRRYAELARLGLLAEAGRQRAPTARSGDASRPSLVRLPRYFESALRRRPRAWKAFQSLPPSHRRRYLGWVDSAKREETRIRRLDEALRRLSAGERLGLK